MRWYLVERFVPAMTADHLAMVIGRGDGGDAGNTQHVWTLLIGADETCLSLYQAADAEAVRLATGAGGLPADRVVEVTVFG